MASKGYWLEVADRLEALPARSEAPFEGGARSASEACKRLRGYGVDVNLVTLRWFQNQGLIDKPHKEGRNAIYSRPTLEELTSIRILQTLYGRTVEDLKALRRRGIRFTETLDHLLRLERSMPLRGFPGEERESFTWPHAINRIAMTEEFFDCVLNKGTHPGRLIHRKPTPPIFKSAQGKAR